MKDIIDRKLSDKANFIYELSMAILTVIAIAQMILQEIDKIPNNVKVSLTYIDIGILIIFTFDYFIRLLYADKKWLFVRSNIIELLAIIPFNSLFRSLRIFRALRLLRFAKAVRLLRVGVLVAKLNKNISNFLKTNNFIYIIWITIITVLLGAISISYIENMDFTDAIWWAFVTATTVGYGDISPETSLGRIIASILMLVGIGFIGMLTGTIATYFMSSKEPTSFRLKVIEDIKNQLDNKKITKKEMEDICKVLMSLCDDDQEMK